MDERQTIRALRARDPRGITAVYDRYAEGLYDYCWWLLRDHGTAREACRDALLAAGVHADALRDPQRLRPWLYALVRTECLRRGAWSARTATTDGTPPDSTELRSLAWKATEALPPAESEALRLHVRHSIASAGIATILGRSVGDVTRLVERARTRVSQALRTEMLAVAGPADCAELPGVLDESSGQRRYERGDRHTRECSLCAQRVPRRVSVARLMALLPHVAAPTELREHVIDAYAEPRMREYCRLAGRRLQPLGRDGFPRSAWHRRRAARGTATMATISALVAASLCAAVGVFVLRLGPLADGVRAQAGHGNRLTYEEVGVGPTGSAAAVATLSRSASAPAQRGRGDVADQDVESPGHAVSQRPFASGLRALTPFAPGLLPSARVGDRADDRSIRGDAADASGPSAGGNGGRPPTGGASRPGGTSPGTSSPTSPEPTGSSGDSSGSPTSSSPPPEPPTSPPSSSSPTPTNTGSPTPTNTGSPTPTDSGSATPTDTGSSMPSDPGSASPSSSG